jgi:uncharacterized membrane protein
VSHETTPLAVAAAHVPASAAVLVAATLVVDLALLAYPAGPVRFALAVPLLFVLPGYALVCALFPTTETDLDGLERAALALPASLAALAVVGLVLSVAGVGLSLLTVVSALSLVVGSGAVVTALRRDRSAAGRSLADVFRRDAADSVVDELVALRDRLGRDAGTAATVVLAAAVVLAALSVGVGLAVPPDADGHDSLHLLTEGADGELVAGGYPDTLARGESVTLVVGVDNDFDAARSYTVVAVLERVEGDAVVERTELDRLSARVGPGERWTRRHRVTPPRTGEDLRLSYLLFVGDPPADPTRADARHATHLWVTVEAAG